MAKKGVYVGTGVGLILFAIVGLLPGSLLGGMIGLNIAGTFFGQPVTSALVPRVIVGLSMLLGVFVSGVIFIAGSSIVGWLIGSVIDSIRVVKTETAEVNQ